METKQFTKNKLSRFIEDIISSSQRMSFLQYCDENNNNRMFIEDVALECIMKKRIDRLFEKTKTNQKEVSKLYKHLNGTKIQCYLGRVKSPIKASVKEFSLFKTDNSFGEFDEVVVEIGKTFFNGKILTIYVKNIQSFTTSENIIHSSFIKEFKIKKDDIQYLNIITDEEI